jgi:drug/metabolite transporter (DMT)-like permease
MDGSSGRTKAALSALAGAACIGLSPIGVRLSEVGPAATNFWRFAFALPILALWALADRRKPSLKVTLWLLFAGVLFGIEVSLWAAAVVRTTVANATLLTNLTPVFGVGFGWLFLKERLNAPIALGIVVGLGGAALLALARAQAQAGAVHASGEAMFGDALGASAAVGYAGYLLVVRALGREAGVGAVMFWATLAAALVAASAGAALHEQFLPRSLDGWLIVVGLGLVVHVGGQGLIAYGVGRLPIALSTVLLWMQPLVAALLSWIMFDEKLSPLALTGAALVLVGMFTVQRARA